METFNFFYLQQLEELNKNKTDDTSEGDVDVFLDSVEPHLQKLRNAKVCNLQLN